MRRVKVAVPLEECKRRCLSALVRYDRRELIPANVFASAIWPDTQFKSQGAGAAASRILKQLSMDGHVEWSSNAHNWGWRATSAGRTKKTREDNDGD